MQRLCYRATQSATFALLGLMTFGLKRPAFAQPTSAKRKTGFVLAQGENPIHRPNHGIGGSAPSVQVGVFLLPTRFKHCHPHPAAYDVIASALFGAGLTPAASNAPSGNELCATNAHVSVLVTCAKVPFGQHRVVVISASTDSATAGFYRNDVRSRIRAFSPVSTPPGEQTAPTRGDAIPLSWGSFNRENTNLSNAEQALAAANLKLVGNLSKERIGQSDHVAVVVAWAIVKPADGLIPNDNRFIVVGASTNSTTGEYYRNTVRSLINPTSPPVVIR